MNTIHFVIKRLANIRKYLEQNLFLEKIAPTGNFVSISNPGFPSNHATLCKAGVTKKLILQKTTQSLCHLLFIN